MEEQKIYIVYKRTSPSGHAYIGYTGSGLMERWAGCVGELANIKHTSPLANAIRKYGPDAWVHEILFETYDKNEALDAEMVYISLLGYYNLAKGGTGGNTGRNGEPDKIARQAASLSKQYDGLSEEEKQRRIDANAATKKKNGTVAKHNPRFGTEHGNWNGYWYVNHIRYKTVMDAESATGIKNSLIASYCVTHVDKIFHKSTHIASGTTPRQNGWYKSAE